MHAGQPGDVSLDGIVRAGDAAHHLSGGDDDRDHDALQDVEHEHAGQRDHRYDAPLFFANARDIRLRALAAADDQGDGLRWFVLNVEANVEIDITALDAVEELRAELAGRGIVFALAGSSRTCWSHCARTGSSTGSGQIGSSRPCPPPRRPTTTGERTHPPDQAAAPAEPPAAHAPRTTAPARDGAPDHDVITPHVADHD
jgi:MFS superfamily sulfate permease-like transporter